MRFLFLKLLDLFDGIGEIKEALMYSGGQFSTIEIEVPSGTYTVSIRKNLVKGDKDE